MKGKEKHLPKETWVYKVSIGVANTGFLPTNVTEIATKINAVLPVIVTLDIKDRDMTQSTLSGSHLSVDHKMPSLQPVDGYSPMHQKVGQLAGRLSTRIEYSGSDGTAERALCTWIVEIPDGVKSLVATAVHPRAGTCSIEIPLDKDR